MSIWTKFPELTDDELRTLVAVSAEVLVSSEDGISQFGSDFLGVSPLAASRELTPLFESVVPGITSEQFRAVFDDKELSAQICKEILAQLQRYPELADEIAKQYDTRINKMASPELILLTSALLVLAIKLKEINWRTKRITFYESSEVIKDFVRDVLTSHLP